MRNNKARGLVVLQGRLLRQGEILLKGIRKTKMVRKGAILSRTVGGVLENQAAGTSIMEDDQVWM